MRTLAPLLAFLPLLASPQGTQADYDRAFGLAALTRGKVYRANIEPQWLPDGGLWYRVQTEPQVQEWVLVEADGKMKRFNSEKDLKAALGDRKAATNTLRLSARPVPSQTGDRTVLTFDNQTQGEISIYWLNAGERVAYGKVAAGTSQDQGTVAGHSWEVLDAAGKSLGFITAPEQAATVVVDGKPPEPVRNRPGVRNSGASPDGKWVAFVKENNLWVRPSAGGDGFALSLDGKAGDTYAGGGFFWSPDGTKLVGFRTEAAQEHKVNIVSSSPRDQLQPKLIQLDYLKPGDKIEHPRVVLFDVAARSATTIEDRLFPIPWDLMQLRPQGGSGVTWSADGKSFYFAYNQRGHQVLRVVKVDAASGVATTLFEDTATTFLHYAGKYWAQYLPARNEVLWMSERSGWNHLYAFDATTGVLKRAITSGKWVVRGVESFDEKSGDFLLRVAGRSAEQDPYYVHYLRVNAFTGKSTALTEADGTHRLVFSPSGERYLSIYSRVDLPPLTQYRRTSDGMVLAELEKADATALLGTGWKMPQRFVAKGRDGQTDIYGIVFRPTNFDPAKKYPVIEQIYAGPQGFFVPKQWSSTYTNQQQLAELGFLVVQIDGMGTDGRGKAFHDVCFKNLRDAGFPDRIAWMKAVAQQVPQMDLTRVGVYGGSAGGQNAMAALLWHGDFYKAAAADCGCHDNRMDKIWWNEQWMGYPVDKSYEDSSNMVNAHLLTGKLLLTVGEVDSNVDPASTMQVVNALIRANKQFEFVNFPGGNHGAGDSPYGKRKRMDFFVRSLLGVEPPKW